MYCDYRLDATANSAVSWNFPHGLAIINVPIQGKYAFDFSLFLFSSFCHSVCNSFFSASAVCLRLQAEIDLNLLQFLMSGVNSAQTDELQPRISQNNVF